jgi:hypothetical protein
MKFIDIFLSLSKFEKFMKFKTKKKVAIGYF